MGSNVFRKSKTPLTKNELLLRVAIEFCSWDEGSEFDTMECLGDYEGEIVKYYGMEDPDDRGDEWDSAVDQLKCDVTSFLEKIDPNSIPTV